ncbi:MAG: hypothetical protein QHH14_07015 [Clostridiales bacterium]|nr:hypothetical protein [Clostridiales bacterium]
MTFFFVKDFKHKYRFFSSEPQNGVAVKISRSKEIWQKAQKKMLLLPSRILRQEQAFMNVLQNKEESLIIRFSGLRSRRRMRLRFLFFLHRQRTKHILLLLGESLLLPLSGLAALLPGPNVAFAFLALLMITHWRALRGINRLAQKKIEFVPAPSLSEWEEATGRGEEIRYPDILQKLETEFRLPGLSKILWK